MARTGAEDAVAAASVHEARLTELLPLVKGDDDARQEFVDLLEVMGAANPATADWRRRLTSTLF
ncbi:MAG: tetratricopeptide repeat protein [Actinobacteria bacterium]|nr:tetratricopeptide repeat protein [Actinomycetota bacterium]